jgi:hypothetical protein
MLRMNFLFIQALYHLHHPYSYSYSLSQSHTLLSCEGDWTRNLTCKDMTNMLEELNFNYNVSFSKPFQVYIRLLYFFIFLFSLLAHFLQLFVKKIVWFFPKTLKNLCFGRRWTWPFPKHKKVIFFVEEVSYVQHQK